MEKPKASSMECNKHTLVAHVAALHHSSALLLKYRVGPDSQQGWFLPNDDLHHLEHPEQAARRILKEQAGVDDSTLKLAEMRWFEIDKLPPAEDFAHHGWGRAVLVKHALGKAQPLTT